MIVHVEFELELISFVWEFVVFLHFAVMHKHHMATEEAVFSTLRPDLDPIAFTHLVKLGVQRFIPSQVFKPIKDDPSAWSYPSLEHASGLDMCHHSISLLDVRCFFFLLVGLELCFLFSCDLGGAFAFAFAFGFTLAFGFAFACAFAFAFALLVP